MSGPPAEKFSNAKAIEQRRVRLHGRQWLGLADDGVFQAIEAFIEALDLGLQKVAEIVEAVVHGVAQVVDARFWK